MSLSNQHVVVLGGTSGIGLATARAAAGQGARVTVVSSSAARVGKAVADLPEGSRGEVADLADPAQVAAVFARIGSFDHLVYTAGEQLTLTALDGLDLAAARDAFTLRCFGALGAVAAAAPYLSPEGSVVLTTGIAKDRPGAGWTVAAAICGAVEAMVRAMAVELAPVRVNAVSPGIVRTPLWSAMDDADREAMYAQTAAALPVGRVGSPEDIAEAYVFLLRERFATGTVLTVDGGGVLV